MIIYFTGTGNSRFVAREISKGCFDEITDSFLYIRDKSNGNFTSEKPYVFVCPTYAYKIPRVFEDFIMRSSFSGNKKAYFVMTCGSYIGSAQTHLKKLCKEKDFEFMGVSSVIMPENYICMFDVPSDTEAEKIIKNSHSIIKGIIELINEKKPLKNIKGSRFMTYIVNPVFYSLFVKDKKFYATDKCTDCGKCLSLCPMNNISLEHGKPKWKGNCTHCQACICACPREAIEYGGISKDKNRYYLK